jgi:hypothetical protein
MNDTLPEIEQKMHELIMARSGAERLRMGASMFESAKAIIISSLPKNLPEDELKRQLFRRIYGSSLEVFLAED